MIDNKKIEKHNKEIEEENKKEKTLNEYGLGEEIKKDLMNGLMIQPNIIIRKTYSIRSSEGIEMDIKHSLDGEEEAEYRQCYDCVHYKKPEPNPCSSCDQPQPTNFSETEP